MTDIRVLPLRGYKSLKALNAFHALLLGLKMLPAYMHISYAEFHASFEGKSESEKEHLLREAAAFVNLAADEVEALVSFTTDKNGVPFTKVNVGNLDAKELHEIVVAVCMAIGRMRVDLISEDEKKKLADFSVDIRACYVKHPELELEELVNLAFYEALRVQRSSENHTEAR